MNQDNVIPYSPTYKNKFGSCISVIGTVIITNTGSFNFKNTEGWDDFKNGKGLLNVFEAEDYADLTKQNIIEVNREGYKSANLDSPDGIVQKRYSHPRRWRTEKYLKEPAIRRMSQVLEAFN